jgi:hypothetical protein
MDEDLDHMTREELIDAVNKKLRQGIRQHRDSSRHELCWHHSSLWGLLPEKTDPIRLFDCAAHRTVMHCEMSHNLCERVGAGFIGLGHRHLRVAVLVLIPLQAADDAAKAADHLSQHTKKHRPVGIIQTDVPP